MILSDSFCLFHRFVSFVFLWNNKKENYGTEAPNIWRFFIVQPRMIAYEDYQVFSGYSGENDANIEDHIEIFRKADENVLQLS